MNSAFRKLTGLLILLSLFFAASAWGSTPKPPDVPRDYVVDLAGIIDSGAASRLNAFLRELERKTTAQVLVLTVQSLDGQSIEEFAIETKEKWNLGQKRKDNGVLIVVAAQDRKYRFEIGYGLEGALPDSFVGSLGRDYLAPFFRKGDYGGGITTAALVIVQTIAAHENVQITDLPEMRQPLGAIKELRMGPVQTVLMVIALIIVVILFVTHPGQCFLLILASQMSGRGGWSSNGGGGFGGGSFGGGGGGSGGGGGASGGW